MKKTLAIILSVVMLLGVMPFATFAADESAYDRAAVAANDEEYIADMTAEQMASLILDWVDREIAKYSADIKAAVVEGVVENGFEGFEIAAFGDAIAAQIPDIDSLDAVIAYKSYLTELGGDFATLDATNLVARGDGTALDFIYGVFQFMADNSETFGKVFRWDEEVFDYGKVGEYIETFETAEEGSDEKAIYDFYIDYLIGNDIQAKFTNWVAGQMDYEIPEGETFDDTLNNGILGWFVGLCEANGILSEAGIATLKTYDLRTTDIYTLVENFVGLVQSDNQVKIDTYYNYIMDTVVRTLVKTMLGQQAVVGAEAEVPASFTALYTDLDLLKEISGGKAYYYDGEKYYQVTIGENNALTANALTWEDTLKVEFNPPVVGVYTGGTATTINGCSCDLVQEYKPDQDYTMTIYSSYEDQINAQLGEMPEGMTATVTSEAIPAEIQNVMIADNAKAMKDLFGVKVDMGETNLLSQIITFNQIATAAEAKALEEAQIAAEGMVGTQVSGATVKSAVINDVSIDLAYNGYATTDEFICQVTSTATVDAEVKAEVTVAGFTTEIDVPLAGFDVSSYIQNPVATIVLDNLDGDLNADIAANLPDYIDDDFVVDQDLLDFTANYKAYNGVVGQANRILVDLTDMLLTAEGEAAFDLTEGNNDNFTANLQKVCDEANAMMAKAEELLNDAGLQDMLETAGIDFGALTADLPLDLLYAIDFSSVEALWVSVITLGLDMIDVDAEGEEANIIDTIHDLIGDLTNLDAMAVAVADYVLADCIPALNTAFEEAGLDFALTVPTKSDAAAVADGEGKDIIMDKLVDVIYEAAVEGVALVNTIANEALDTIGTEIGMEMPTVAFELGVAKGADWQATLTALTNRVYDLAAGIILACNNSYTDTFDKISAVANAILPLGSLASNCAGNGFAFDINTVLGFIFDDALEGKFDGFLRLYETDEKTADVAANCSVTEALINASQHIVDAFFPDTVVASDYVNATSEKFTEITVQEYFTSAENDAVIASNNMDSLNVLKADLVTAVLNLAREAGVLPFFAKCDQDHTSADLETVLIPGTDATCTENGVEDAYACAECDYVVSGGEVIVADGHEMGAWTVTTKATCTANGEKRRDCANCDHYETDAIAATGHITWSAWTVTKAATCTEAGVESRTCSCGKTEYKDIAVTAHPDADGNSICDVCGHDWNEVDDSFFGKIKAFFQKIIDWFKNLFSF